MHGISQDPKYLVLYLDYIPGGELFNYLRTIGNLNNEEARFYAAQVTLMFEYLHKKDIIYRDLKPENLLIDKYGYLKLTDFGFAKHVEDKTYTLCGTPEYLAPEILLQKGHSKPVDWWCLGILIYEMLVGIDPFSDDDPMAVYQNILKGKIKFPKNFPKEAKSLVKHLLVADLTKRFGNLMGGVNDIKEHKWFAGFEWDALLKRKKQPPYLPEVNDDGDTQQFSQYQNSTEEPKAIAPSEDPFINW